MSAAATSLGADVVLRREPFGGILFDRVDGTQLELDGEAYQTVRAWLAHGLEPEDDAGRDLLGYVREEASSLAGGRCAFRDVDVLRPEHRDLGIGALSAPTLVDLQITDLCHAGCPQCYASSVPGGEHMAWADVHRILGELGEAGVCQLAIGGGEPLLHPDVVRILERAREVGLVPSLTTTGTHLTPAILEGLKAHTGAVALSLEAVGDAFSERRKYGFAAFERGLEKLLGAGVRTVLQVTLSAESFVHLPDLVDYALRYPELYGVIFLAYKPAGRGITYDRTLWTLDKANVHDGLRRAFTALYGKTRVGYDCCLGPGIAGLDAALGLGVHDLPEGCSAARTSVGITTQLDVVACTFVTSPSLGNLRHASFLDVWNGDVGDQFRDRIHAGRHEEPCGDCPHGDTCLGGCPEWELVRCHRR